MTKVRVNLSFDPDVWEVARKEIDNVSHTLNAILRQILIERKPEMKKYFEAQQATAELEKKAEQLRIKLKKEYEMLKKIKAKKDREQYTIVE